MARTRPRNVAERSIPRAMSGPITGSTARTCVASWATPGCAASIVEANRPQTVHRTAVDGDASYPRACAVSDKARQRGRASLNVVDLSGPRKIRGARSLSQSNVALMPRLDTWKAIARYLDRTVRTVQRWERLEGLPVRRHVHRRGASVYALQSEVDHWRKSHESVADASAAVCPNCGFPLSSRTTIARPGLRLDADAPSEPA